MNECEMRFWSVLGIVVQLATTLGIYYLSRRMANTEKLHHREKIKAIVDEYLYKTEQKNSNREVYLMNIDRYFKDYPANESKLFQGYCYIGAEIKTSRFNGVEFFQSLEHVYEDGEGRLSFKEKAGSRKILVYQVGIIPYEWIEAVDTNSDEFSGKTNIFCHFKSLPSWKALFKGNFNKYPYLKKAIYYTENPTYQEGDPSDWKWKRINSPIH